MAFSSSRYFRPCVSLDSIVPKSMSAYEKHRRSEEGGKEERGEQRERETERQRHREGGGGGGGGRHTDVKTERVIGVSMSVCLRKIR